MHKVNVIKKPVLQLNDYRLTEQERKLLRQEQRAFDHDFMMKNMANARIILVFVSVIELFMVIYNLCMGLYTGIEAIRLSLYIGLLCLCGGSMVVLHFLSKKFETRLKLLKRLSIAFIATTLALSAAMSFFCDMPLVLLIAMTAISGCLYVSSRVVLATYIPTFVGYMLFEGLLGELLMNKEPLQFGFVINMLLFLCVVLIVAYLRYIGRARDFLLAKQFIDQNNRLTAANHQLETISITDRLTGLHNRWAYTEDLEEMFDRCKKAKREMALVIFDLDNFKLINDRYGHSVGDSCLISVANAIDTHVDNVRAYRYGGEEFIMLFESITENEVTGIANDIRIKIQQQLHTDRRLRITVSGGVYCRIPDEETDVEKYLVNADRALYVAKLGGKNKIEVYRAAGGEHAIPRPSAPYADKI